MKSYTIMFWLYLMQPQTTTKPTVKIIWYKYKYTFTEGVISYGVISYTQKAGFLPALWYDNNTINKVSYLQSNEY